MRARCALLPTQDIREPGTPTADRVPTKHQARNSTPRRRASDQSLVSDSSRGAQDGSAENLDRLSSSQSPILNINGNRKDHESTEQERHRHAPSLHQQLSTDDVQDLSGVSTGRYNVPQSAASATAAPDPEIVEAPGERLLHFALPWAIGQRVLAFMAREDARSVDSNCSETLPAYDPRG